MGRVLPVLMRLLICTSSCSVVAVLASMRIELMVAHSKKQNKMKTLICIFFCELILQLNTHVKLELNLQKKRSEHNLFSNWEIKKSLFV